jgi:hypothetical protein
MAEKNLTPKALTPREQLAGLLAVEHGITKAHAVGLIDRAFRHLKAEAAGEASSGIEIRATVESVIPTGVPADDATLVVSRETGAGSRREVLTLILSSRESRWPQP